MAVATHVEDFASYTTMHGFSRIVSAKATPKRIAWIIVFATAWIIFTIQMSFVLRNYFEYPKELTTDIVLGGVPFPAITLCNLGSFDFYTVYRLSKGLADVAEPDEDETTMNETETSEEIEDDENMEESEESYLNDTFIRAMNKYYHVVNESSSLNETDSKTYRDRMFSRTTLAANIPITMLSANGVQENEFIVKCTYRKKPCRFKKIFDPYFFNCYSFTASNVAQSTDDNSAPLFEGIENGFSVMLLAGTRMLKEVDNPDISGMPGIYSKDSALSGAGGVRVVIHPPGTRPFPLTEGYDIPPGQMATLSLTPKRRKRLGKPYGNCNDRYPFLSHEEQKLAGPYRRTACEKVCIQNHIQRKCECYENTLPIDIDILFNNVEDVISLNESNRIQNQRIKNSIKLQDYCFSEKYLGNEWNGSKEDPCKKIEKCSGTNEFRKCFKFYSSKLPTCDDEILLNLLKKIECADRVKDRVMSNATLLSECGCHPSCNDILYDVSYSLSQWPSQGIDGDAVAQEIFGDLDYVGRFSTREKKEFYINYTDEDFKRTLKDFSKINVYVSNADVFLTTEVPAITTTQLISDIGGQLGVWIGVSVLTIAEVLEILILMLVECCRKTKADDKSKDVETHLNIVATEDM